MGARAAFLFAGLAGAVHAAPAPLPGRLPAGVAPIHYDISIDPDAKALAFAGQETITLAVAAPTRTITLDAADLAIGGVQVDGVPARWTSDEKAQRLTVRLAGPIKPGVHRLAIG